MNTEKGVIHILFPLIIVLVVAGAILLIAKGIIKIPGVSLPTISLLQKEPTVQLKEDYKNPFKKETQYVNPFETYKNPFILAK